MKFYILFFTITLLCSCSKSDYRDDVTPDVISIGGGISRHTRATNTGFINGDKIGVFIADNNEGSEGLLADARVVNKSYIYDDTTFTTSIPEYWSDVETPVMVWGVYPYDTRIGTTPFLFTIAENQSLRGSETRLSAYEASDLLLAKTPSAVSPTKNPILLNFMHALSKISLTVTISPDFNMDITTGATITVSTLSTQATIDMQTNKMAIGSTKKEITLCQKQDNLHEGIVFPETVENLTFKIVVGGKSFNYTFHSIPFQQGKQHLFTLQLTSGEGISMTVGDITDWNGKDSTPTEGEAEPF